MSKYFTHIWDLEELRWYEEHERDVILVVPACAEFYGKTRNDKLPLLCIPESMLPRGSAIDPDCEVCDYLNLQIRQGTVKDPDIWEDLPESPWENT